MSRTGVGCRVMIDGLQLDDGCLEWGGGTWGEPWTETRRNYFADPRATSLNVASWSSTGGASVALSLVNDFPGASFTTAVRSTRLAAGNVRLIDMILGPAFTASTKWRFVATVRASVAMNVSVSSRPRLSDTSGAVTWASVSIPVGVSSIDVTGTTSGTAPTSAAYLSLVHNGSTVGGTLDIQAVMICLATDTAPYFDGSTAVADPAMRVRWTDAANASPSVQESGTFIPTPTDDRVPFGVMATSGLSITWGRDTTVDQPQASTCAFKVVDEPGGSTVLQTIKLGSTVDVFADADIAGPTTQGAFIDPTFDDGVRGTVRNTTLSRSQARAEAAGGWSATWAAIDANQNAVVTMPPGPLQIEGTNPLAWIGILSTRGGETWTITARAWIPEAMSLRIRPVAYTGPYASVGTPLNFSAYANGSSGGGWQTLSVTFAPGLVSAWIGIEFTSAAGLAWGDVPPDETWADADASGMTWADLSQIYVDTVSVLGPGGSSAASVLVFSGRITDLEGLFDPEWDEPAMSVTATDFLGDLGNRYIGDEPWPMETVPLRMTRILSQAAPVGEPPIQVEIATAFQNLKLSWDDVDHQSAANLSAEVAESIDGVLWSATHPVIGPYMRLENPTDRLAMYQFALSDGTIIIANVTFAPDDPTAPPSISACEIIRDPVRFVTNVSDVATRVSVEWQFQTTDEDGNPTTEGRRAEANDLPSEIDVGTRAVNVQSLVTTSTDAQRVADQLLARLGSAWRISGLAVADADIEVPDATAARMLILLLDGVTRGGQPLLLSDLPYWSPTGETAPIYLEGGTYTFIEGGWDLDLTVSRAAGQGSNARWNDLPNDAAWKWDAFDPSITWDDLRGVKGP